MNLAHSQGVDLAILALKTGEAMPSSDGRYVHTTGKSGRSSVFICADSILKKPLLTADSEREIRKAVPLMALAFDKGVGDVLSMARTMPTETIETFFGPSEECSSVPTIRRPRSSF